MPTTRPLRALAALVTTILLVAACGADDDADPDAAEPGDTSAETSTPTSDDDPSPVVGGEIVVGLSGETPSYLPGAATVAAPGFHVAMAIFDPIAARGADGQIHPFVAESIVPDADATEWTVRLRDGITFHDGTALDAEVMREIFYEYLAPDTSTLSGDVAQVSDVRVDDDLTFTYVLSEPNAAFADLLTGPVGWPFSVDACRAAGDDCGAQIAGTGPFRLESWVRDSELVVERNQDYWRTDADGTPIPYLDRITFRPIPDNAARWLSVESGTIDAGHTFQAETVARARDADGVDTYEWIGNGGGYTALNTLEPPLDDVRVRRALRMAVDQEQLIAVLGGEGISPPLSQLWGDDSEWFSPVVRDAWSDPDVAAATALIDEYVEDPTRSDGERPGEPVRVTYQSGADPTILQGAQYYQAAWGAIGVETQIDSTQQATLIGNVIGSADQQPPFRGTFQASLFGTPGEGDPYTLIRGLFGDPTTQPMNASNHTSDAIARNLEVLRTSTDFDERYAANQAVMLEVADEVPVIWHGAVVGSIYTRSALRNVAGWTIPGSGGDDIAGSGVAHARTHWSHVWLDAG